MSALKASDPVVVLAGGGTGGHIYPNVAIAESIHELRPDIRLYFWVSDRPGDAKIMGGMDYHWEAASAVALPTLSKAWKIAAFTGRFLRSMQQFRRLSRRMPVAALVTTGGFVSGPPMMSAYRSNLPRALVNLDAVPGKANRQLFHYAQTAFTVYEHPWMEGAQRIGLPLRRASLFAGNRQAAKEALGMDPERPLLFVTGATHGATSIIDGLRAALLDESLGHRLRDWQIFHQCGTYDEQTLRAFYDERGVSAKVVSYCKTMGAAWSAADLAISRAGAGSVAEAWANATPTLFMPNPYHADGHQRRNCAPLVKGGGAVVLEDRIEAQKNAPEMVAILSPLIEDAGRRETMRAAARASAPQGGAEAVARWAVARVDDESSSPS